MNIEWLARTIDLEFSKKVFLCLSAAVLLCVPIDAFSMNFHKPRPLSFEKLAPGAPVISLEKQDVYLKVFERSTLFGSPTATASAPIPQASLNELIKDYRLKGVVLMASPEAVVEDARTQRTFFVQEGEKLGELDVKEIGEGYIVLSCQGGEARLEI